MSNKDIAHAYAKQMLAMTNKVWVSDNLPTLSRESRREILAIYKKYFKVVDYDAATGICKCWVNDPEPIDTSKSFGQFESINIKTQQSGAAIKASTLASIGANSGNLVQAGTIVTNM
jgi:hypothetical protein